MRWGGDCLEILDQRQLPTQEVYLELRGCEAVARAIEDMAVRGAPAIGCAAAFGVALAAAAAPESADLEAAFARLARTRPTAVNLFWALGRMRKRWEERGAESDVASALLLEAQQILTEDVETCRAIGGHGEALVPQEGRVLTHCNAGALATAGYGTALGVVRAAVAAGRSPEVFADETRPFLQGARLTAWELDRDGIPVTVIADSMAGHLMARGEIDLVLVGADRIARNGDVANKIGTYSLAVLAAAHEIPFYVAAPRSSIDFDSESGAAIPIEERSRAEMAEIAGTPILPEGVAARHPAFDITPARLVDAIVTEAGVHRPPYTESLRTG
jgi:methylthioribose-1-phosphate isomerase